MLAADQFVKYLTIENLPYQVPVPVLGEFLQLYYVRNPGAAFSLGSEVTWIFTIALAVVACVIIWKAFGLKSRLWAVVLGCLLGGVLGNLSDRLFRDPGFPVGHVVDMISMPWMMPAIFIVTGMICVALLVVFGLRFDGTRERDHAVVETEEEAEAAAAAAVSATETDADVVAAEGRDDGSDDDTPSEDAAPASEGR